MDLRSYFGALYKHLVAIILAAVLGLAAAFLAFSLLPAKYASTVSFYVSTPLPEGNNAQSAAQFAQARVSSYVLLLSSDELARQILLNSRVNLTPREVASRITADSSAGTVIIRARVTDTDRERARALGDGLTRAFPAIVDQLDNQGRKTDLVVINVVSGPATSSSPVSPNLRLLLLVGLAAGVAVGVIYAFARELFDSSIRTPESAQQVAKVPGLAVIPFDPNAKRRPLALVGSPSGSPRAEAYRKLRTNIKFLEATGASKVILMTSATAEEGKTLTALNLALSLVEAGERVLFIDADLRAPAAAGLLDVTGEIGLSNVLAGEVRVEEALQSWGDEDLTFLAAGTRPPNPSELLSSYQMQALLSSLSGRYEHIIIDSPPLLPVTDAAVMSAYADLTVLVVRADRTRKAHLYQAVQTLEAGSAVLAGTVLNGHRAGREQRYASYRPRRRVSWEGAESTAKPAPLSPSNSMESVSGMESGQKRAGR